MSKNQDPEAAETDQTESIKAVVPAAICSDVELARSLLMYAVEGVLAICGNSYMNACTEQWLDHAASLGAYPKDGPFIGNIKEVREKWSEWLDENGGLPEWPDSPHWLARMGIGQNVKNQAREPSVPNTTTAP